MLQANTASTGSSLRPAAWPLACRAVPAAPPHIRTKHGDEQGPRPCRGHLLPQALQLFSHGASRPLQRMHPQRALRVAMPSQRFWAQSAGPMWARPWRTRCAAHCLHSEWQSAVCTHTPVAWPSAAACLSCQGRAQPCQLAYRVNTHQPHARAGPPNTRLHTHCSTHRYPHAHAPAACRAAPRPTPRRWGWRPGAPWRAPWPAAAAPASRLSRWCAQRGRCPPGRPQGASHSASPGSGVWAWRGAGRRKGARAGWAAVQAGCREVARTLLRPPVLCTSCCEAFVAALVPQARHRGSSPASD